jgi:hypothetical protein
MADEPDNIVLVMLGRMDEKLNRIDSKLDRPTDDVQDLKVRMTSVGAGVNGRLDRLEVRVDRIEQRLELVEPSH